MDERNNFNLTHWPIVYLKSISGNNITDESFEDFKKMYLELLVKAKKNNEKIILICNINTSGNIPLKYIMKQAQFNKEIYKFNKEFVKGVCILCKDKSFKNILNLYFSVAKPAAPFKLCRSYEKANKYLNEIFNVNFKTEIFENVIEEESNTESSDDKDNEDGLCNSFNETTI
jgi:hypothetical protein